MSEARHIALVGMPGAGKTTVGRLLAARLGLPFIDSDAEVETAAGVPIAELFAAEGEAAFRVREREVIARGLAGPPAVIATGGGAFADPETHALLLEGALTVWLQADLATLQRRTDGGGRPLIEGDRNARLAQLLDCRRRAYAEAVLHVDGEPGPEIVAARVEAAVHAAPILIPVGGERPYRVLLGSGLLADAGRRIAAIARGKRVALVADSAVDGTLGAALVGELGRAGLLATRIAVSGGEAAKSWAGLARLVDAFADARLGREDLVVALGGGVVGDLAGLAAALYMRGIDWVGAPTTLLAAVDSSVGGKTAIDIPAGKNLAGAFWPPRLVLADLDTLGTLPARELRAGYAEVLKYAFLGDADFADWLEAHGPAVLALEPGPLAYAVERSIRAKAAIVAADERERGPRALLNLGHSFGHALEAESGFSSELLHGEAVAVGCALAFQFSVGRGLCPPDDAERVVRLLRIAGLPAALSDLPRAYAAERILARMAGDKKNKDGALTLILARGIGRAFVQPGVAAEDIRAFLAQARAAPGEPASASRTSLTSDAVMRALETLPGWRFDPVRDGIARSFRFPDFGAAFAWMTRVALHAERVDHHADWSQSWNRVEIFLRTHDAGGVTQRDLDFAAAVTPWADQAASGG